MAQQSKAQREEWIIEGTTHGMSCAGCAEAVERAITMAKVTGSVGATHNDNGYHAAKVKRNG